MRTASGDDATRETRNLSDSRLFPDVATKQDIADLRSHIEACLRQLVGMSSGKVGVRHMNVEQCAAYIGRTPEAVRMLVKRGQIPNSNPGRRQFDREKIDRWMERHARRGRRLSG